MSAPKMATAIKWGLGLLAAAIIAPVIFLIVKGLVGLLIAGLIGLIVINAAPVLAMKLSNLKLKGIKHEASTNPVETLQLAHKAQGEALSKFKSSIVDFHAEVANFEDQVETFSAQFPQDATKFAAQLASMKRLLGVRENRYLVARDELAKFAGEIRRAEAIWKMSQAAQRLNKAAGLSEDDFLLKIKTETAIDSVQTSLNKAFAELETSLLDEVFVPGIPASEKTALPVFTPDVRDMSRAQIVERVR